jgi:hypothetical protein
MQKTIINNIKENSIENDFDSVILLLSSAQIPSTAQWEINSIVQCWNRPISRYRRHYGSKVNRSKTHYFQDLRYTCSHKLFS